MYIHDTHMRNTRITYTRLCILYIYILKGTLCNALGKSFSYQNQSTPISKGKVLVTRSLYSFYAKPNHNRTSEK